MEASESQEEITTAVGQRVIQCRAKWIGVQRTARPTYTMCDASRWGASLRARRSLGLQKPLNELGQAFAQLRCRTVAKQFSRFRNVRICTRHIARLFREAIDFRFLSDGAFNRQNQIFQLNRLTLTEIKDVIKWAIVIERSHRALN